ncbi:putative glycolipid-binding domain-containing protein [Mycobacterium sp. 21AC1]|uniref:putative glycolipid-binding domain-containing protein n=1 Tax=[Mycobacterium] appelbergii TaxID=2939269 RepID=UPI0029393612|nr:putative glycolipid-binding domain-containing protein [Mycobacterium sp. 21AC1]MDV3123906.1 putative glycolipid-binding domain-containing protein [Mycobacterium sp. 21AC1]
MRVSEEAHTDEQSVEEGAAWPAVLTWRAHDVPRMESVRVQLSGNRIRAYGRIVAAATTSHPAFSASYDLVTDEAGGTKRLSLSVTLAERGERQLSIARDEENMWLVQDHAQTRRSEYDGALDVDVIFSPFFNALPIRRAGLHQHAESVTLPVVYVRLPDLSVEASSISYSSQAPELGAGIKLHSPVADTTVTVDADGFILDYPGLAERI